MAANGQSKASGQGKQNVVDEKEVRQESSKAAEQAQQAQKKANELRQAAHGAADADERQKLMEQAIDKEIEAESFGKTAKYLRTGTFQGMAAGTGLGVVPGATLGTITGTLVGGLTSMITGGLGAAGGALVGAIHGPFWNLGQVAGKQIQKVTGNLPSWKATESQKKRLEVMMGQAKQEDMPTEDELEYMRRDNGTAEGSSWAQSVSSAMSYIPDWMKGGAAQAEKNGSAQADKKEGIQPKQAAQSQQTGRASQQNAAQQQSKTGSSPGKPVQTPETPNGSAAGNRKPSASSLRAGDQAKTSAQSNGTRRTKQVQFEQPQERKQPKKLEVRSQNQAQPVKQTGGDAKKPRKLERRS